MIQLKKKKLANVKSGNVYGGVGPIPNNRKRGKNVLTDKLGINQKINFNYGKIILDNVFFNLKKIPKEEPNVIYAHYGLKTI